MSDRDQLLRAFGIGPDDLDANRGGRLGERQKRHLVASGMRNVGAAMVVGLILVALLLWVVRKPLVPAQWITASVLFGAAAVTGLYDFRRTRAAAADGRVETLAGVVSVSSRGRSGWFLEVAGRSFRMPVRPWQVQSGKAYRVYHAALANRVVAMEPDGWD